MVLVYYNDPDTLTLWYARLSQANDEALQHLCV